GSRGFSGDGGPAAQAQLYFPQGIAVDSAGNLYIADMANQRVRKVATDGTITTVAGNGQPGYGGDGGLAVNAQVGLVQKLAVDSQDNLYILGSPVRKITPDGMISNVGILPGAGSFAIDAEGTLY